MRDPTAYVIGTARRGTEETLKKQMFVSVYYDVNYVSYIDYIHITTYILLHTVHITCILHLRLLWLRCMKQACRNIVVFLRFSHKVVLGVPFVVVQVYLGLANQGETCGRSHVIDSCIGCEVWKWCLAHITWM